ncbi:SaPI-like transcriptional repressor [Pseudomonas phage DDSR119]|nr:SaPI-like transcriptional repressor [Pseudomonas phage DDSR119]
MSNVMQALRAKVAEGVKAKLASGYTQQRHLASFLDVPQSDISRICRGEMNSIKVERLLQIAHGVGVEVEVTIRFEGKVDTVKSVYNELQSLGDRAKVAGFADDSVMEIL